MRALSFAILISQMLLSVTLLSFNQEAFAHPLEMASHRQSGDYLVELGFDPIHPIEDQAAKMSIRIATTNGDDLALSEIALQTTKGLEAIDEVQSIRVVGGHYARSIIFPEAGRYVVNIDARDSENSAHITRVAFTVDVISKTESMLIIYAAPITGASIIGLIILANYKKKKRAKLTR